MGFLERRRKARTGHQVPATTRRQAEGGTAGQTGTAAPVPKRELRRPRRPELLAAVRRLDAGLDEQGRRELADWVKEQYTVEYGVFPLGFVAKCYLGPPYVEHRLDLFMRIVEHHSPAERMADPFERARMLVRTGGYECVEVYQDGLLVPVNSDGTAIVS